MEKHNKEFPVSVYGNLTSYNNVLSKARCRIFYKGANRNGTYISDDFADKLISSLHYVPIKGIYSNNEQDFTDHGTERRQGQIYGIVPETNNFAWERHLDEDGVEREYACTDVLIFSALYSEAKTIFDKPQSMELYEPSLEYHQEIIGGQNFTVFDAGSFLGLQVLGEKVEPCFEGAAFFELQDNIFKAIQKIEEYSLNYQEQKGGTDMFINFKMSDRAKHDMLWNLLNTNYTEEGNWEVEFSLCEVYEDYAIAYNYSTNTYERVYYSKDEADAVSITNRETCHIVDVNEKEQATLEVLRQLNGNTYDLVDEKLEQAAENFEKIGEQDTKISELEEANATLITEKENMFTADEYNTLTETVSTLTEEINGLKEYKTAIEANEKTDIINEYTTMLSEEVLEKYTGMIDSYSASELDRELAYELKKTNFSAFNKDTGYLLKEVPLTGIESILSKY